MMSHGQLIKLPSLSVMDLNGKDAEAIMHNLTTNEIKSLQVGQAGTETFITNVKGKCLGHGVVHRTPDGFRFLGAAGQSEVIAAHADRYTIREDAVPVVLDSQYTAWLIVSAGKAKDDSEASLSNWTYRRLDVELTDTDSIAVDSYLVPWCLAGKDDQGWLMLTPTEANVTAAQVIKAAKRAGMVDDTCDVQVVADADTNDTFHRLRVAAGFPWYGIDIDDSHLPQEINREPQTISFTKGCYLGQETVARLDALGQVQKKLVAWEIQCGAGDAVPEADLKLFESPEAALAMADPNPATKSKPVGRLTSVAANSDRQSQACLALGFARRSHFEPGATAHGHVGDHAFTAVVVASDLSKRNHSE